MYPFSFNAKQTSLKELNVTVNDISEVDYVSVIDRGTSLYNIECIMYNRTRAVTHTPSSPQKSPRAQPNVACNIGYREDLSYFILSGRRLRGAKSSHSQFVGKNKSISL